MYWPGLVERLGMTEASRIVYTSDFCKRAAIEWEKGKREANNYYIKEDWK